MSGWKLELSKPGSKEIGLTEKSVESIDKIRMVLGRRGVASESGITHHGSPLGGVTSYPRNLIEMLTISPNHKTGRKYTHS